MTFLYILMKLIIDEPGVEGQEIWVTAENAYNERVSRVENQIIARLRDRLGTARNANEMFRVFSKFNALFVRPKVRLVSIIGGGIGVDGKRRSVVRFKSIKLNSSIPSKKTFNVCIIRSISFSSPSHHPLTLFPSSKRNIAPPKPTTCLKCVTCLQ